MLYESEDLRLQPAKGGAEFPDHYDQTTFAHSVNVSTVGGLLYEAACLQEEREPTELEMRALLHAGAFHDLNKFLGKTNLFEALRSDEGLFEQLVGGSLPPGEWDTVRRLILQTEDTTSKEAVTFSTQIAPKLESLMAHCLNLADALSGGRDVSPNDHRQYRKIVKRKQDRWSRLPEIHILPFTVVPQSLLAENVREAFLQWIRDEGGAILHVTSTYVSWVGPSFGPEAVDDIEESFIDHVRPSLEDAFQNSTVGRYSTIKPTWIRYHEPSPENVEAFIEQYLGQMLLLQGDWANDNFGLLQDEWPHFRYDDSGGGKNNVNLEVPEIDEISTRDEEQELLNSKILIASCLAAILEGEKEIPDDVPADFDLDGLRGVTKKTAIGILRAHKQPVDESIYMDYTERISSWLSNQGQCLVFRDSLGGFVQKVLGIAGGHSTEVATKSYGCVYCGAEAEAELGKDEAFGFGPTAWGPRKKGVQSESAQGNICSICVIESQIRQGRIDNTGVPGNAKKLLGVHLHAADLWVDSNIRTFLEGALGETEENVRIQEGGSMLVLIPKSSGTDQTVPGSGHVSTFMPLPEGTQRTGKTLAHLYRLRDLISFASQFGFKVHVTPLQLHARHRKPFFVWENGPGWLNDLGFDSIRIDDIRPSLEFAEALIRVGREAGSKNGHAKVISAILQQPLEVYSWPVQSSSDSDEPNPTDVLEREMVSDRVKKQIDEAASAFCEFNPGGQYSKNKWTWAPREALDAFEEHWEREDRTFRVAADLYPVAERKNEFASRDDVEEFVYALEMYLADEHTEAPPIGRDKRSLINAVAYRAQRINTESYQEEQPENPEEKG